MYNTILLWFCLLNINFTNMESLKGVQYDKQVQFRKEALWQKLCITTVYYWHVDGNYGYGFLRSSSLKNLLEIFYVFSRGKVHNVTIICCIVSIFMRDYGASYGG